MQVQKQIVSLIRRRCKLGVEGGVIYPVPAVSKIVQAHDENKEHAAIVGFLTLACLSCSSKKSDVFVKCSNRGNNWNNTANRVGLDCYGKFLRNAGDT